MSQHRGEGTVAPFEVIPFTNGNYPSSQIDAAGKVTEKQRK
jgi:hypothetical protein